MRKTARNGKKASEMAAANVNSAPPSLNRVKSDQMGKISSAMTPQWSTDTALKDLPPQHLVRAC